MLDPDLLMKIDKGKLPRHIAIVMDGMVAGRSGVFCPVTPGIVPGSWRLTTW